MTARASLAKDAIGTRYLHFQCPGCDEAHGVPVVAAGGQTWGWNESLESPTLTPSLLLRGVQWPADADFHRPTHDVATGQSTVCHSFITDGRIQFLGDSTHALAGQTVDLPEWPHP